MGDFLCRLIYFQYTGAILEWNMDRRLRVGNDKISGMAVVGNKMVGLDANSLVVLENINYKYQYKCQTLLGWQSAESHGCQVFKCTSVQIDAVFTLLVVSSYIPIRFI
jgi:hypothetical protein